MTYEMILTEEQYNHIARCVEVCHRIACGQVESLNEIIPNSIDYNDLVELKEIAFPELSRNESYGWNGGYRNESKGEPFRKAFDKFQAQGYQIYRQMCYKQNIAKGIDNVLSSPTLTTDKAKQPIISYSKTDKQNT